MPRQRPPAHRPPPRPRAPRAPQAPRPPRRPATRQNPLRPGNILINPETTPNAPVPLAGGKAAAAANPGYFNPNAAPPIDPIYNQQVGAATKTRDDAIAYLGDQRNQGLASFGYNQQLQFDPNNPFSQAAMLKRSYDQARTGSFNRVAAQGGLYSGSMQNAQADVNFRQQSAEDALKKRLIAFLTKNTFGVNQARNTFAQNLAGYEAERLNRAIAAGQAQSPPEQ